MGNGIWDMGYRIQGIGHGGQEEGKRPPAHI